jgi:hypothetical protein
MNPPDLIPAEPDDLTEAIAFALRFNNRGKPLGMQTRDDSVAVARGVVLHLVRCGLVVMRRSAREAHSTSRTGHAKRSFVG